MSALSESLKGLIDNLTQIGNAAKAAQQQSVAIAPQTRSDVPPINQPSPAPVPEKRIAITLNLPRVGRQETIVTDQSGADALVRIMEELRSELERS